MSVRVVRVVRAVRAVCVMRAVREWSTFECGRVAEGAGVTGFLVKLDDRSSAHE
jgi:hypothetical protein